MNFSQNKNLVISIIVVIVIVFVIVFNMMYNVNSNKDLLNNKNNDTNKSNNKEDIKMNNELFSNYYDEAEKIMKDMTIEEKVSQVFLVAFKEDLDINDTSYLGGYIFFADDFKNENPTSFLNKILTLQNSSKINYALAVDEEGGSVTRVSKFPAFRNENFSSPRDLFNNGGLDLIKNTEIEKINLLKSIGLNLNLAPVADISIDPNDYMYNRSIGLSSEETANYIAEVTKIYKENNFSSCLKHFPGYGSNADTHKGISIDYRTIEDLKNKDLIPFSAGINAKTPFVLISHNIMVNIDNEKPSTLSSKVINILKEDLNFSGIIITDDLSMSALDDYRGDSDIATLAILAGNDMIITRDYKKNYEELMTALANQKITEERLNYSVRKIIAWKIAYEII